MTLSTCPFSTLSLHPIVEQHDMPHSPTSVGQGKAYICSYLSLECDILILSTDLGGDGMNHVSSYRVKLHQSHQAIRDTLTLYRQSVTYLIQVIQQEWAHVNTLKAKKRNVTIHSPISFSLGINALFP